MDIDVHALSRELDEVSKENGRLRRQLDEQAQQLEQLRASEERLRALTDSAPVAGWSSGPDGESLRFNATWRDYTGLGADESSRSRGWATLLHHEDRDACLRAFWAAFDAREPFRLKYRIRQRDGQYRWVLDHGQPRFTPQGQFTGYSGALVDITELQETAEALRQSEERFRMFGRATNDAIRDWDFATNLVWWNEGLQTLFGYPTDETTSRADWWQRHIHPDDRERIWAGIKVDIPHGHFWSDEYRFLRADGTYAYVYDRGYVVHDANGRPVRLIGAMLDITARKEGEQALRDSEERLRMALDGGQIGTWAWDLATNAVRWGGHAYRVFDLAPGTFGGTFDDLLDLVHPDDRPALVDAVNHAIDLSLPFDVEFRTSSHGSQARWIASQAQVYCDERGKPARMLGVVQDVTERKRLESQFLQAQKMEGIGRLAGGVAHDFNNLLTAILGYIEMGTRRLAPDNPAHEYLHSIRHAAERSAALIRQLLAFARRQITEPRLVDLNVLIGQTHELLRRVIGEDIELRASTRPDLGAVRLDPAQFEQVLMNLVINARDAMPDGGILSIETADVELDEHYARQHQSVLPGSYVMLAVSDTGIGMTEEVSSHLFEPFFTTKPPGKGTGLGLATCYGIIKQNGGHIWVYSEYGRGSTFKIFLPRASGSPAPEPPLDPTDVRVTGNETVLVVEDEPLVRAITVETLETLGYHVLQAGNGEEALTVARAYEGPIDILVTDVVMPAMGGPALTQHLQRERRNVKVLYVSGYTDDAIVHHGVVEPGIQFLQKPFPLATLARRIRELLAQRQEGTLALPFDR
jgi:PAS domain S-box-containing protein